MPLYVAYVYVASGDQDKAVDCLEQGVEQRSADVLRLAVDPAFDGLRSQPRYQALGQKMGL